MKISKQEQHAIRTVVELGARWGFGNLITHLRTAWMERLMTVEGLPKTAAQDAAGGPGYPLQMHKDLMERGEWDETGERYSS